MRELLPHSTPSLQWASAQGFPGTSVFNSPRQPFSIWISLLFRYMWKSGIHKFLRQWDLQPNDTLRIERASFRRTNSVFAGRCWAIIPAAVPEGSRLPQQSFVPPRQLRSLWPHAARAKAALWDSWRFSPGFCQHSKVRSLFISERRELSHVRVLLQIRQLWFSCRAKRCEIKTTQTNWFLILITVCTFTPTVYPTGFIKWYIFT